MPSFLGVRVLDDYPLEELVPYIDWSPFFMAWELRGKYPRIFDDPARRSARPGKLFDDARRLLDKIIGRAAGCGPSGVYGFWPAASDGDDILLYADDTPAARSWPGCTRCGSNGSAKGQEASSPWPISSPRADSGRRDYLGGLRRHRGHGPDELVRRFEADHDDYSAIMAKALADRLAEAFAERLHQVARRDWGYGRGEQSDRRRADRGEISRHPPGPRLSGLPRPHREADPLRPAGRRAVGGHSADRDVGHDPAGRSVSGLYFAHPRCRYFAVDRITRDQVEDYARRKGMKIAEVERWLGPNLGYDPQ